MNITDTAVINSALPEGLSKSMLENLAASKEVHS